MHHNRLAVMGVGRLGLCLALCLEKAGYEVLGVDRSPNYTAQLNQKTFDSSEPFVNSYLRESQRFCATDSLEEGAAYSDLYFIAIPTGIPETKSYDHTALTNLLQTINTLKLERKHVVICSAVLPGYIEQIAIPALADCPDCQVSYNPEFIAQGTIIQNLSQPDLILIGEQEPKAGDELQAIYLRMCSNTPPIERMSIASAEITRLAINCFVMSKIALANLIGDIADETLGADKHAILHAVGKDRRVGDKNLTPGFGYGGPFLPRDNCALGSYAESLGIDPLFFRATEETNERHAEWMVQKLLQKDLSEYIFEDVGYKPNCPVPITEHSQKLAVAKRLAEQGKNVTILDTEGILVKVEQQYHNMFHYQPREN